MPRAFTALNELWRELRNAAQEEPFRSGPTQHGYNPNQPRVPAGNPDGGQWSDGNRSDPRVLSDATPDNHWIPGAQYAADGHHFFPRQHWKGIPPETQKVFDAAKTGYLPVQGWHWYDEAHRQYNRAAGELLNRFMDEHMITPEQMTPDHARAVLRAIAASEDPRIQSYREMLMRMRTLYRTLRRLRSGSD